MVSVAIYVSLTIAATTDVQLLNRAAPVSTRLPILGLDIPYFRFYWVAPLFLVCLYFYFHSNLQAVWARLADLPAKRLYIGNGILFTNYHICQLAFFQ